MRRLAAEFVVIVVGVLVALGVDSWVQDRADRSREQLYLEDLREDLASGRDDARRVESLETSVLSDLDRLVGALRQVPLPPADSLARWFDGATRGSNFRPGAATADALLETGALELLRDDEVRRLVAVHRERVRHVAALFDVLDAASYAAVASLYRQIETHSTPGGEVDWSAVARDGVVRGELEAQRRAVEARRTYTEYLLMSIDPLVDALDAGGPPLTVGSDRP